MYEKSTRAHAHYCDDYYILLYNYFRYNTMKQSNDKKENKNVIQNEIKKNIKAMRKMYKICAHNNGVPLDCFSVQKYRRIVWIWMNFENLYWPKL